MFANARPRKQPVTNKTKAENKDMYIGLIRIEANEKD